MKSLDKYKDKAKFRKFLETIGQEDSRFLEEFLSEILDDFNKVSIDSIWQNEDNAISYWILLINGINNPKEVEIIKDILFWSEFFGRNLVKVRCIQSSDNKEFSFCLKKFGVQSSPVIIFSNNQVFTDFVKIDTSFIKKLSEEKEGFITLFNQIHQKIINGNSLKEISKSLRSKNFWRKVEKSEELKKLISENKINLVISRLTTYHKDFDSNIYNELISIASQYNFLQEKSRLGSYSNDETQLLHNKIIIRLLKIVDGAN